MPNASHRIEATSIKAMSSMFLMFNSLDSRVDITMHPKFYIIINNVSRYGESYDPVVIKQQIENGKAKDLDDLSLEERITDIKTELKKDAINFHLSELVSDDTRIGTNTWKDIKASACLSDDYKESSWFSDLTDY